MLARIMPVKPPTICRCGRVTQGGLCPRCRTKRNTSRPSAARRGYGWWWRNPKGTGLADAYLRENPLCEGCAAEGIDESATLVHHKIPHNGDEELLKSWDNLEALCRDCHAKRHPPGGIGGQITRGVNPKTGVQSRFFGHVPRSIKNPSGG